MSHHEQMQQGYDFSKASGEDIAKLLGKQGYTPSYDSNTKGSGEANFNNLLQKLTPEQLLLRYENGDSSMYATGLDVSNAAAYNNFKSIVGRAPTASELAQALPIFQQANGVTLGNAWLSQYKQQLLQNPNDPLNKDKSGTFSDSINQTFKTMLGRNATQDELNHFGGLLATGNTDQYQLQDFLRGTPEYQSSQDKQFRNDLSGQLQENDLKFYDRAKQGVISQFMQNGTGNSSALDSALTDLMGQVSQQRDSYLAQLSAQQYGGNKNLALGNYQNTQNQFLDNQNMSRQNSMNQMSYLTGRSNELSDYNRQMQDYMNFYNSQKPNNMLNYINTGLNTVNTGVNLYRSLNS